MRRVVAIAAAMLIPIGCSMAPTDQVLAQLAQSDRSWCVSVTTVYGTLKMGGSGADQGVAICTGEGFTRNAGQGSNGGLPIELAPVRLRMVPQ